MRYLDWLGPALLLLLVACDRERPTETDTDSDTDDAPECEDDEDCGPGRICEGLACEDGDRDNAFQDATPLLQNQLAEGEINPAGDVDFYVYESPGDEWIRVETITGEDDADLDTVLQVYRSNGALHLALDDYATGRVTTYDSLAYVYLPEAGSWYLTVEDRSTYYGEEAQGGRDFTYTLEIKGFSSTTRETDSMESPSSTVEMTSGSSIWAVGINLEEEGDADWLSVSMPWDEAPLEVWGYADLPGSEARVQVEIYEPGGELVVSKDDVGPEGIAAYFNAVEATYTVRAADALGAGGPDYWFVLYFRTRDNGTYDEQEMEPNDTPQDAGLLDGTVRETSDERLYIEFETRGELDPAGDQDWFAMDLEDPYLSARCSASGYGSLADPSLRLFDPGGALILEVEDGTDSAPDFSNLEVETGLHMVRLVDQAAVGGLGAWYTCRFWSTDFEVAE